MHMIAIALLVLIVTILMGVLVFVIARHNNAIEQGEESIADMGTSITAIKSNLLSDEVKNTAQIATSAAAITALATSAGKNVMSDRFSMTTPTTAKAGDSLSLSTTAPSSKTTQAPSDSTKWLQLTDKDSTNYANLGVGSMWADTGVSMAKGACVDFGNGMNMCGDTSGFVSSTNATTGLQMTLQGAAAAVAKNVPKTTLRTSLPGDTASGGMNRIVGDTIVTGDLLTGGNVVAGTSGAVNAGMLSSSTASHIYSGVSGTVPPAMSLGWAAPPATGGVPTSGNDVIQLSRTTDFGNHVKILGDLQICDEAGASCWKVTNPAAGAAAQKVNPGPTNTGITSVWGP